MRVSIALTRCAMRRPARMADADRAVERPFIQHLFEVEQFAFGAAALDLAWVAAGRYDGFWELGLKKWDMAAGLIMVKEAGGAVADPEGEDPYASGNIVAGNQALQPKLREIVAEGIAAVKARPAG